MRQPFEIEPFAFESEVEPGLFARELEHEMPPINLRNPEFVKWVQASLNQLTGAGLAVDGILGPLTRAAVHAFQQQQGLIVDGIVGPQTAGKIQDLLGGAPSVPSPSPSPSPGYQPSPTRLRFEQAVAQYDWEQAFLHLNGLNMYEMLRALNGLSSQRLDELMWRRDDFRQLVNMPRIEYAMTVVRTDQLPSVTPGDLDATGQVQTAEEFLRERRGSSTSLAWGARVSPEFRRRVREIAAFLQCDPNHLMAVMAFETGESFSPSIRNRFSGATGLIQFMPATARGLGTTTDALAAMTSEQQLNYVARYFAPFRGRLSTIEDVYMAVLWPRAVGAPNETVLFASPSRAYVQNKGLDTNRDGKVTKFEAAAFVRAKLIKGLQSAFAA